MNVLETEWWTLALPPEWWADSEEESILIGDQDDVGCIEISTLHKDSGEFTVTEVSQIATDESEQPVQWHRVALGEFSGVTGRYRDDGAAIREWVVCAGSMMLFITYSCDLDNAGMDDAAVDELLDTLMVVMPSD
tara:strand:- start:267541 stop:267945 length:405 start_codon:yes stop_codon:yes gene_type:complete